MAHFSIFLISALLLIVSDWSSGHCENNKVSHCILEITLMFTNYILLRKLDLDMDYSPILGRPMSPCCAIQSIATTLAPFHGRHVSSVGFKRTTLNFTLVGKTFDF